MKDEEYLLDIQDIRNISDATLKKYREDLKHYTTYTEMSLDELLKEAEEEEDNAVRKRKRKIKTHLLGFQRYLKEDLDLQDSTVRSIMSRVKAFYRTYDIDLPQIKTQHVEQTETIQDIPTIEHIRKAASTSNLKHRAIILFMASSGTGSKETLNLIVQDFIDATREYHHEVDPKQALTVLKNKKNVIPTFYLKRFKTGHKYYTFCSPEATEAIVDFLQSSKKELKGENQLFDITQISLVKMFSRANDKYGWGWKKTRRFFHAHSMRMFFATQLTKAGLDYLIIQWLSGRAVPATTATYFKPSPDKLKKEYMKVVDKVSISKVDVYDVKSEEFAHLEETNQALKSEIDQLKEEQRIQNKEVLLKISNIKKQQQQQMENHK